MPLNAGYEYGRAEEQYKKAKTRQEKIEALEELIRTCPKHKGAETTLSDLKSRLAKLNKETDKKSARRITSIQKEGDAQVCILGLTNSGKSTLLAALTNAKPKISDVPYTTSYPEVGMANYHGVQLQIVEIPSTFERIHMSTARSTDGIIVTYENDSDLEEMRRLLVTNKITAPVMYVRKGPLDKEAIIDRLWKSMNFIRVYCKEPGKKPEPKPIVLKKNSMVRDAAQEIHKDFLKYFKFARIWRKGKFPGSAVGLDYVLEDGDIAEMHMV